jgi:hypothetical protein
VRQIEVRYCDGPRKLLGWVQLPDHLMVLGAKVPGRRAVTIEKSPPRVTHDPPVHFPVVSIPGGFGNPYLALKVDGHLPAQIAQLLEGYEFRAAR